MAIGAPNAYVLRQGLRREHVPAIVAVCIASDAVLIAAAVAGADLVFDRWPWVVPAVRVAGAVFLLGYAVLAARRALRPSALVTDTGTEARLPAALGTVMALTWLNPHTYLDTVVLIGSVAQAYRLMHAD